ncbi:MAG: ACP S-malonyltransferase [Pseudomonadales bacterium]|jgi:[acyl-carrier-protein] S-malonyltransferase|tara:strand:+ start:20040 stop:20972 length:933 start_codon:yes stop_codon:yes gene_type:complete
MGKLAYVFPGQGSQAVGMLSDLAEVSLVAETFAAASQALGYDLWALIQSGPEEQLNQTEFTQPALLTASVALWRVAMDQGAKAPEIVAGHSLGEYSALVAAGVIAFEDAVKLVQQRGQFMQTAVPIGQGGMAAVLGVADDQVVEICASSSTDVDIVQAVNFNSPGQVVIAGSNAALAKAIEALKAAGAKRAMPLSVSAPFHSEMMKPAAQNMASALASVNFNAPNISIIQNVHAQIETDPDAIRSNLVLQMHSAVLWTKTVQNLVAEGVDQVVECGPGKVLAGLNKRIDKSISSYSINNADTMKSTVAEV